MLSASSAPPGDSGVLDKVRATTFVRDRIAGLILASFYAVHRELGAGLPDLVYNRALALELTQRGLKVERDLAVGVFYKGTRVGQYCVDLAVEGRVAVQVRANDARIDWEAEQLARQLRRSNCSAAMLLVFGPSPVFRMVAISDLSQVPQNGTFLPVKGGPADLPARE